MIKHFTISFTNKHWPNICIVLTSVGSQSSSWPHICIVVAPAQLTNTPVGPTQYFTGSHPIQQISGSSYFDWLANSEEKTFHQTNILEHYWAPKKQCHLWSVPWRRLAAVALGREGVGFGGFWESLHFVNFQHMVGAANKRVGWQVEMYFLQKSNAAEIWMQKSKNRPWAEPCS